MAEIRIEREYPYPVATVWRAVTDPELVPRWTATGQGGRPVGYAPVVGTRFQFVGKPVPGWNGVVDCEVLEVEEPSVLRFSWVGGAGGGAGGAAVGGGGGGGRGPDVRRLPAPPARRRHPLHLRARRLHRHRRLRH